MLAGAGGQHLMARPYSQDLRDRVIGSVASGRTCRATAALFGVSVASVVKWSQRWRASGSAAAKPMGGWKQLLLTSEREWLLARIAEKPDLTLRAVVAELAERGTPASYGAVWRFFKREGISFKKSLYASEQDRADIAGVDEVVGAFLGFEAVEECADAAPGGLGGARIGFAQQGLELGEDLLDRVEVGRIKDMDYEGVDVHLTLPSGWFGTWTAGDDVALEMAMYRAYHRWMEDYCGAYPNRLGGVILAGARDIEGALAEIRRCGQACWAWGMMVYAPAGMPLDHPALEPLYAEAAELDLAVVLHIFTVMPPYAPGGQDTWDNLWLQRSAAHPWCGMRNMAALIGSGVMDRYPTLRVGTLEAGHGWLPFWMATA